MRLIGQLVEQQVVTAEAGGVMRAAISGQALSIPIPDALKDAIRARSLKVMLTAVARQSL